MDLLSRSIGIACLLGVLLPASTGFAASDGEWAELAPPQRAGHVAAYDPSSDRVLAFGGTIPSAAYPYYSNDTWVLGHDDPANWARWITSGDAPPAGSYAMAAVDPAHDRMLVVSGGFDVWSLNLSQRHWTLVGAPFPGPNLFGSSVVYDPTRQCLMVFGGDEQLPHGEVVYNDVWVLDLSATPTWSHLGTSGTPPSPRYRHTAIYDATHDRMIVFGGQGLNAPNNEVWSLELSASPTWVQLNPSGTAPSARSGSLSVYDAETDAMLVFGGTGPGNDVWALSLAEPAWTSVAPTGTPPSTRPGTTLMLDSARHKLILYGGSYDTRGWELWSLSLGASPAWTLSGPPAPQGRYSHSAVYDPVTRRMIVFAGATYGDVWSDDLGHGGLWSHLQPGGPSPASREGHAAILDPVSHRMIVFGGSLSPEPATGSPNLNDTWALTLDGDPAWFAMTPMGTPPSPRWGMSAIYDPVRHRMIIFGGGSNDTWALSLDGSPTWTELHPVGTPPVAQYGASAIYDPVRDRMIVYGQGVLSALTLGPNPEWLPLSVPGTPNEYYQHAVYDPVLDRMALIAWHSDANVIWALTLSGTPQWTALHPTGVAPIARIDESVIYETQRHRMVLFGGFTPGQGIGTINYDDTWALTWQDAPTSVRDGSRIPLLSISGLRPNPTLHDLTVEFTLGKSAPARLQVFDVSGRMVLERPIALGPGRHAVTLSGSSTLPSGVYIMRVIQGTESASTRGIVLH